MIKNNEITFVIQGPVSEQTSDTVYGVLHNFDGAQVIVSTYEGFEDECEKNELFANQIIFNPDPGESSAPNISDDAVKNLNRHIVSSRNGILSAKTKYVCKVRSDILFKGNNIVSVFEEFQKKNTFYNMDILENKIVIPTMHSLHPRKDLEYHPSDWLAFGIKEDVLTYYDAPLIHRKYPSLRPEQHFAIACIRKKHPYFDQSHFDYNIRQIMAINFMMDNFIIMSMDTLQIENIKHKDKWTEENQAHRIFTQSEYEHVYNLL